jgi:hypothetical protein
VAEYLVDTLVKAGVERIYGIVGDSLNPVTDALRRNGTIKWIDVRHEESGAYAAGAEAQLTSAAPLPRQGSRRNLGQFILPPAQIVLDQSLHPGPSDFSSTPPTFVSIGTRISDSNSPSSQSVLVGDGVSSNEGPRTYWATSGSDRSAVHAAIDTIFATDDDVASRLDDSLWAFLAVGAANSISG